MSEKKPETQQGKKSVCGDGLSKKERRALKVTEKGDPNNTQQQPQSSKISEKNIKKANKEVRRLAGVKENSVVIVDITTKTKEVKVVKNDSIRPHDVKAAVDNNVPTKALLKAERRALQEQQRLTKASAAVAPEKSPTKSPKSTTDTSKSKVKSFAPAPAMISANHRHQVPLFNHLYNDKCSYAKIYGTNASVIVSPAGVHPAFVRLGAQYAAKTIVGSNARCIALLATLRQLVVDHITPPKQDFCRSLEQAVQTCMDYLQSNSRKQSVSMSNAVRHFKFCLTKIDTNLDDSEKKARLTSSIDKFLSDDIDTAGKAISMKARNKITDGDVILTYGCSSLIQRILLDAHKSKCCFHCIIVDSRPLLEGRHTLRALAQVGIPCTYTLINGICSIIDRASKVLLGAHALLANGSVMARIGTAQVAMVASRCNKPVMVCCEIYKFCERAQVDSYVYNELGDPDALVHIDTLSDNICETPLRKWMDIPCLTPLNLMYDVTPPDYVTSVVTELGMLPCTSVPVILRVKQTDIA